MFNFRLIVPFLAFFAFSTPSIAESEDFSALKKMIQEQLDTTVTEVKPTPLPGVYEVIAPPMVFYTTKDGRYVMTGDLLDLKSRANLSQDARIGAKKAALDLMGEESMIVFAPKDVKHTITVFTDIDCGYCRKLHNEIAAYNKLGIKVRYMAYPRAGVGSESYDKAVSVWCSKDRNKAMTIAKSGGTVEKKNCDNPVSKQFELGQQLGVNGTPAIVLENGQIYPGYAPADKLIGVLNQVKAQLSMKQ